MWSVSCRICVASNLAQFDEPRFLQRPDYSVPRDLRQVAHAACRFDSDRFDASAGLGHGETIHAQAFEITLNSLVNVLDGLLKCVALRGAAGQIGDVYGKAPVGLFLEHCLEFHRFKRSSSTGLQQLAFGILAVRGNLPWPRCSRLCGNTRLPLMYRYRVVIDNDGARRAIMFIQTRSSASSCGSTRDRARPQPRVPRPRSPDLAASGVLG